jgi:N-acetylglucosamine-6-sulfatase
MILNFLKSIAAVLSLALVLVIYPTCLSSQQADATGDLQTLSKSQRPNVLLIISDDQHYGSMLPSMPIAHKQIFERGISFEKAYITTPACCPSRSSILTGQYASRHAAKGNFYSLTKPTIANLLQDAGYYTALVGKYLNSWDGSARPEYDYWAVRPGGSAKYFDPKINVNGSWQQPTGYSTDIFESHARRAIRLSKEREKPFFLVFAPHAPHSPATPQRKFRARFRTLELPRPPSFFNTDDSLKPQWVREARKGQRGHEKQLEDFYRDQMRTLVSVDRSIGNILTEIREQGSIGSTIIIYLSDNGLMLGQHGIAGKDCAYEAAVHVPFAIRYDALGISPRRDTSGLVANIDLAPTISALTGVPIPWQVDGQSLVSLLNAENPQFRSALLLEGWRNNGVRVPFYALHTGDKKFIMSANDISEFYDLHKDPYELHNLAYKPDQREAAEKMRQDLEALVLSVRGSLAFDQPVGTRSDYNFLTDDD